MARKMEIKKVLFFKPGAIGDLLHTLPALKALKNRFPAARITIVVSPGLETLIQGTPVADRVLVFDKSKIKKRFRNLIEFGLCVRDERYDVFADMQPSFRSFLLRRISRAGRVLVYRKQSSREARGRRLHAAENFLAALAPLGISGPVGNIELPVKTEALAAVERLLGKSGVDGTRPIVALNCGVGAARPARNWYPERFAALADRIRDELGATVVFVGGSEDRELVGGVLAGMRGKAVSVAGELTLAQSAALLSRCVCLVSSDTGPLHLATAVQTPVVGLFGSTDPRRTGPIGSGHCVVFKNLPCVPCEQKDCPLGTRACMEAISVDEVFDAVRRTVPHE
jgi:lipopolysaccharide heptosyltransferase II